MAFATKSVYNLTSIEPLFDFYADPASALGVGFRSPSLPVDYFGETHKENLAPYRQVRSWERGKTNSIFRSVWIFFSGKIPEPGKQYFLNFNCRVKSKAFRRCLPRVYHKTWTGPWHFDWTCPHSRNILPWSFGRHRFCELSRSSTGQSFHYYNSPPIMCSRSPQVPIQRVSTVDAVKLVWHL